MQYKIDYIQTYYKWSKYTKAVQIGKHTLKVNLENGNSIFNYTPKVNSMYQEGLSVNLFFENIFFWLT